MKKEMKTNKFVCASEVDQWLHSMVINMASLLRQKVVGVNDPVGCFFRLTDGSIRKLYNLPDKTSKDRCFDYSISQDHLSCFGDAIDEFRMEIEKFKDKSLPWSKASTLWSCIWNRNLNALYPNSPVQDVDEPGVGAELSGRKTLKVREIGKALHGTPCIIDSNRHGLIIGCRDLVSVDPVCQAKTKHYQSLSVFVIDLVDNTTGIVGPVSCVLKNLGISTHDCYDKVVFFEGNVGMFSELADKIAVSVPWLVMYDQSVGGCKRGEDFRKDVAREVLSLGSFLSEEYKDTDGEAVSVKSWATKTGMVRHTRNESEEWVPIHKPVADEPLSKPCGNPPIGVLHDNKSLELLREENKKRALELIAKIFEIEI